MSLIAAMAITIHLEDGELEEHADISEPLISSEEKIEISIKNLSEERSNGGSIATVLLSTFVVALGSLEFGYCVGFSSPTQSAMIEDLGLTLSQYSTFGSLLTIGAIVGAIVSGYIADYMGRKGAFRVSSVSCIIGWFIISLSKDAFPLNIGRLFVGYGVGLTSFTVPVYIAEITPKNLRGGLTATHQLSITIGTLLVYLIGMLVGWRLLAIIGIIPCVLLALGLFFIPESPRWLTKVGRNEESEEALQAFRGKNCDVSAEAAEIRECVKKLESLPKARVMDLFEFRYAHSVIVGVGLMVFKQLGGISAVIFYASEIFQAAGFSSDHAASVAVAALQVPMTAIGALLMDKSGRRPLLMISAGGMSIGCFLVGLSFYIQGCGANAHPTPILKTLSLGGLLVSSFLSHDYWNAPVNCFSLADITEGLEASYSIMDCFLFLDQCYIGTFSLGMGGIPWIIMSEIFPINMKGIAGSLVTLVSWLGSWVITITFNLFLTWSAAGSFFIFSVICASTVFFVAFLLPETKGQTLEEIQTSFQSFFKR